MHTQLVNRLALDTAGADGAKLEHSMAVALNGANAIQTEMSVFALTATEVSVQVQISNDMENWTDTGATQTMSAIGYKLFSAVSSLAATYARLEFTLAGTGKALVAVGINTSMQ